MTSGSREMIGAVMGLITLLLALVLGTLVGPAMAFSRSRNPMSKRSARARSAGYGAGAIWAGGAPLRDGIKGAINAPIKRSGAAATPIRKRLTVRYLPGFKQLNQAIASLNPKTPAQTQLVGTIGVNAGIIEQTRLLMSLQLASPVSWPLLDHRRLLGDAAVLRLRRALAPELHQRRGAAVGAFAVAQRGVSDPRAQRAVHRPVPHSRGVGRTDDPISFGS